MKNITKKDKILLAVSSAVLILLAVFLSVFWDTAYSILENLLNGVELVEDYIKSLGIAGIIVMMIIIIIFFFLPVISTVPIQIACGISYGIWGGGGIVLLAFVTATQLLYLFRQNLRLFSSQKQREKREELEKLIKESDRNIYLALIAAYMLPAVPFLVISNLAASGLDYKRYTLVTTLGMIPDIIVTIFLGEKLLSSSPVASILTLICLIIIIILSIVFNDKAVKFLFAPKKEKKKDDEDSQ